MQRKQLLTSIIIALFSLGSQYLLDSRTSTFALGSTCSCETIDDRKFLIESLEWENDTSIDNLDDGKS